MYSEIYLLDAPYHIDTAFDYSCGEDLFRGAIVKVPFGNSNTLRLGVVTRLKSESNGARIKPVHSVVYDRFSFTEEMLGLCLFLKEYTLCTFGEAARTILPPGALSAHLNERYVKSCTLAIEPYLAKELLLKHGMTFDHLRELIIKASGVGEETEENIDMSPRAKMILQNLQVVLGKKKFQVQFIKLIML